MKSNCRIVFCGTPEFAAKHLEYLLVNQIEIVGVLTQPDRKQGRGMQLVAPPTKQVALDNNIPVYQPEKKAEVYPILKELKPDLVVVIAYGMLLPKEVVDNFLLINVHASLLPKYRGAAPIQAALLNGDKVTGNTIMQISQEMDSGDILSLQEVKIALEDNAQSLHDKLVEAGKVQLLREVESFLASGAFKFTPQDHSKATYVKKIDKKDAMLNFADSAEINLNKVRAYTPWPGAFVETEGLRVKISKAKITAGKFVPATVQPAGKKPMSYEDFCRGYQLELTS
jgi:methionyl-tRNA formyltransferase